MQNDPVLVEKVARAIHDAGFPPAARDTAWEDVVWRDCATGQARAALSVIENEMLASATASPSLGKDQVQASRKVEPPTQLRSECQHCGEHVFDPCASAIEANLCKDPNRPAMLEWVALAGEAPAGVETQSGSIHEHATAEQSEAGTPQASRHVVPPEWQDISTAPKDGTHILATDGGFPTFVAWNPWIGGAWANHPAPPSDQCPVRHVIRQPTHWMPMPDPPAPGSPEESGE